MKKLGKKFYANVLYAHLLSSIKCKDYKWLSGTEEDIERSKTDIKCELFKLIRTNCCDDLDWLDPESRALLLNFMKRYNIINDDEERVEL